jgi:hypothetical protein
MKKQYKPLDTSIADCQASVSNNRAGGTAVKVPLLKVGGTNKQLVGGGVFELPNVKDCEDMTVQVAFRILGMPITKEWLPHISPEMATYENVGMLASFYPFAYHKRIGATYSDRVCTDSTRTLPRCPACKARYELLQSPEVKSGAIPKGVITKDAGFGTKLVNMFVAHTYMDGEYKGICAVATPATFTASANVKRDNFFDLIEALMTPKKLMVSETLPRDYYCDGDGARWIVTEYTRAFYDGGSDKVEAGKKHRPRPYWKLSKLTPCLEIAGVGKASELWWPEVDGECGEDLFKPMELLNFTDADEMVTIVEEAVERVLKPQGKQFVVETKNYKTSDGGSNVELPTWAELSDMSVAELVELGVSLGGDQDSLDLIGKANAPLLRRNIAKMCGIKPTPVAAAVRKPADEPSSIRDDISADDTDDKDLSF